MSDRRYTVIFGAAILTAGLATVAVHRMLGAAAVPRQEPLVAVVVAVQDVPAGVPVPREALSLVPWPQRVAPSGHFTALDSVAGRVTRTALAAGEPVVQPRLALRGAPPGLEGTIAPGNRAIAVRVSEATGVSGLVQRNSHVDVLLTTRDGPNGAPVSRVVMTDLRVVAVGPARPVEGASADGAQPQGAAASIVTLEVTPAQAALLAAAEAQGAVQVVLRGFGSPNGAGPVVATLPTLPGGATGMSNASGMSAPAAATSRAEALRAPLEPSARAARSASARPRSGLSAAPATPSPAVSVGSRAETATVRVYRNGQLTVLQVEPAEPPRTP